MCLWHWTGFGRGREGVKWFFQPPPLNTVNVQSVFNDGHPIYYLLYLFDKQCSCEWLVQFICQTVNSFHHIGVICNGKVYVVGKLSYTEFMLFEC